MEKTSKKLNENKMTDLVNSWTDLAKKNNNQFMDLYNEAHEKIGVMEQGIDGWCEIILVKTPYFDFVKAWLYPPADKDGYVHAHGLVRKVI